MRLQLILGDQLDIHAPALGEIDRDNDVILMAEVAEEAEHVANHRQRLVLFLSAMRHFAGELSDRGYTVRYVRLDDNDNTQTLGGELARAVAELRPVSVSVTEPGDHRVAAQLRHAYPDIGVLPDESFTCTLAFFEDWAAGRKELVMEYFYRQRRRALDVLMDGRKPAGGQWNYDKENREAFSTAPEIRPPYRARPDAITREVIEMVEERWPDAPGAVERFDWPVTRAQARRALDDFIEHRLPQFGTFEDAMWADEPVLYHSRLAASLNLKLISPTECVEAAIAAYENGDAQLNSVEGFVRQLIGWREFIRGVYFHEGPDYSDRNGLEADGELPGWFWDGDTGMNCLRHCLGEVVDNAWGHHIPRLMVIGNFALVAGIRPQAINDWFLGMYVDAVDWVTAPNVIGMSQHADGGVVGTKPYAASGKYIQRMSNYCDGCRYNVKQRSGSEACPFNVFYWDFLIRHRERFRGNRRMAMILKNVDRLSDDERDAIRSRAHELRVENGIAGA